MEMHPLAKRALLTAYADTNAAIDAINEARVHYYLMKPWDPPEEKLFPALDDLLHDWTATYRPLYEGIRVLGTRSEEHTSELQSRLHLVCRLLLEKKNHSRNLLTTDSSNNTFINT